jgi:hypothetical protein
MLAWPPVPVLQRPNFSIYDNKERLVAARMSAYLKDNQFRQVKYDVLIFSSPENFILTFKNKSWS